MSLDNTQLLEFLKAVDEHLPAEIRLNAVGGTALTLLQTKAATIDVDFDVNEKEYSILKKTVDELNPGFKVDLFCDGYIFTQQLPKDYAEKCVPINAPLKKIRLYSLAPIDIIVSKAGRLNARDIEDIRAVIHMFGITKQAVSRRARKVEYAGKKEFYDENIRYILEKLC